MGLRQGKETGDGDAVFDNQIKRFEGYLILDYRSRGMRVTKKSVKHLKPFEIPVKIDITLRIPRSPDIVAKGDFDIPPVKVKQMFVESL
jgi:hypothetical protein